MVCQEQKSKLRLVARVYTAFQVARRIPLPHRPRPITSDLKWAGTHQPTHVYACARVIRTCDLITVSFRFQYLDTPAASTAGMFNLNIHKKNNIARTNIILSVCMEKDHRQDSIKLQFQTSISNFADFHCKCSGLP